MVADERFQSFSSRYDTGQIPWDGPLPPPEVLTLADQLGPGRALDIGSGYGRSAIYLAQRGWTVDGVEFVPRAVAEAQVRASTAGVADRVTFYVADVSNLDFLTGLYDLALDIGCMHSLSAPELEAYRDGLLRLLPPNARYVLFAHLADADEEAAGQGSRWISEEALYDLFAGGFVVENALLGTTQVADNPPWRSGWFYFRRVPPE